MESNFNKTTLESFNNSWFRPHRFRIVPILWYFVNILFLVNPLFAFSGFKILILRLFGARIAKGVVLKQSISVKYPWKLSVGANSWIGEQVWIDNLDKVEIGANVCISQGAMLLTGNHDYTKSSFDLITNKIILEDGVWIGAKSVVCPGIVCKSHSVLTVGSIATKNLEPYAIYQGNPAAKVKDRRINS